jgi:Fe-S cluster biogenesis protein NfuA
MWVFDDFPVSFKVELGFVITESPQLVRSKTPIVQINRFIYWQCTGASNKNDFPLPFNNMAKNGSSQKQRLFDEISDVIQLIRPSIQADGGDIELVSVDDEGVVSIRFLGACIGCPSLDVTLQHGIEMTLKSRVDGVSGVRAVD